MNKDKMVYVDYRDDKPFLKMNGTYFVHPKFFEIERDKDTYLFSIDFNIPMDKVEFGKFFNKKINVVDDDI